MPTFVSINPFVELSNSIPTIAIQGFLLAMAGLVIGGVVLTGGFGTVVGIMFGAVIFGIAREAFFYIPYVDGSFYRVFLGFVLLSAALTNENIRKRITGGI